MAKKKPSLRGWLKKHSFSEQCFDDYYDLIGILDDQILDQVDDKRKSANAYFEYMAKGMLYLTLLARAIALLLTFIAGMLLKLFLMA